MQQTFIWYLLNIHDRYRENCIVFLNFVESLSLSLSLYVYIYGIYIWYIYILEDKVKGDN